MRRGVGIAAVVVAVVVAVWWLRREDRATPPVARAPARDTPRGVVRPAPPGPRVDPGPPVAPARGDVDAAAPAPSKEDTPPAPAIRPLAEVAAEADPRLRSAARACVRDPAPPSSGQLLAVRYTLVIAGGAARIEDVVVVSSDLDDGDLEDCIVGAIGEVRWDATGAADARMGVQASLPIADL